MLIVISRPECTAGPLLNQEAAVLSALLDCGLERLHLRKPAAGLSDLSALTERIDLRFRDRLVLHPPEFLFRQSDVEAALRQLGAWMAQKGLRSLHVPAWLRARSAARQLFKSGVLRTEQWRLSTGVHRPDELSRLQGDLWPGIEYRYVLVSPVFDSLSKPGYTASPALWQLPSAQSGLDAFRLIAMGGVRAGHLPAIRAAGFEGAALLGALWGPGNDHASCGLSSAAAAQWKEKEQVVRYYKKCVDLWKCISRA